MPREIVILSPTPPDSETLLEVAAGISPDLEVRILDGGAMIQLCRVTEDGESAVFTVSQPQTVANPDEIGRLLPGTAPMSSPLWWIEAYVPWRDDAHQGVEIARALAARLGAACVLTGDA